MKMPAAVIREEIRKSDVISFARFMELALYCPETGYYEAKKDIVGRRGDFITSVSVGSLFGELLAFQFAEWLGELPIANYRLPIVEAGAHDGRLAADILSWLRAHRPGLFETVEYIIIEPSPSRQHWQKETLADFAGKVSWASQLSELKNRQSAIGNQQSFGGIIFSNELLDAFPVHRYGWDAGNKSWFEWGVALEGENFCWVRIQPPASSLQGLCPSELENVLPDGYMIETSPAAGDWWREAAAILSRGKLLTIDYGHSEEEIFSPARTRGTLRAYHQHHVSDDLLANPGEQDLTAHVDFSAIQKAGEAAGLRTEQFCTQPQFLTRILQRAVTGKTFASVDAKQVRQFQTLTHPEHLGRAFRVLVQSR
ncbi:MAG TPA: SAM-dependent methyltransferase [Verrucomicrobiae bacterium]|nr:SAM-dependent methyltransferase [Verrucomicrobiae bacterium]